MLQNREQLELLPWPQALVGGEGAVPTTGNGVGAASEKSGGSCPTNPATHLGGHFMGKKGE